MSMLWIVFLCGINLFAGTNLEHTLQLDSVHKLSFRYKTVKTHLRKFEEEESCYRTSDITINYIVNNLYQGCAIPVVSNDKTDILDSPNGEIVTEAEYREPLHIVDDSIDGWYRVELPIQRGYEGYISSDRVSYLVGAPYEEITIVAVPYLRAMGAPNAGVILRGLRGGTVLPVITHTNNYYLVDLEEGPGWVPKDSVIELSTNLPNPTIHQIVSTARRMLGEEYIWGGATWGSTDCSGFINLVFRMNGFLLKRDCGIQYTDVTGKVINLDSVAAGDVMYISTYLDGPSHVGIVLDNNRIIHCCNRGVVEENISNSIFSSRDVCGYKRFCSVQ